MLLNLHALHIHGLWCKLDLHGGHHISVIYGLSCHIQQSLVPSPFHVRRRPLFGVPLPTALLRGGHLVDQSCGQLAALQPCSRWDPQAYYHSEWTCWSWIFGLRYTENFGYEDWGIIRSWRGILINFSYCYNQLTLPCLVRNNWNGLCFSCMW
jgi:hypothetical protein